MTDSVEFAVTSPTPIDCGLHAEPRRLDAEREIRLDRLAEGNGRPFRS